MPHSCMYTTNILAEWVVTITTQEDASIQKDIASLIVLDVELVSSPSFLSPMQLLYSL